MVVWDFSREDVTSTNWFACVAGTDNARTFPRSQLRVIFSRLNSPTKPNGVRKWCLAARSRYVPRIPGTLFDCRKALSSQGFDRLLFTPGSGPRNVEGNVVAVRFPRTLRKPPHGLQPGLTPKHRACECREKYKFTSRRNSTIKVSCK